MTGGIDSQREYTATESAGLLGVTRRTVGDWLRAGTLSGEWRDGSWFISGSVLLRVRQTSRRVLDPKVSTARPGLPPKRPRRR